MTGATMTRLDELTLRLADGEALGADEAELQRLIAQGPAERRRHVDLLRLEAALRTRRREVGAEAGVMERINHARREQVVAGVMRQIEHRPAPAPRRRTLRAAWAGGLAVAALAAGFVLWVRAGGPPPAPVGDAFASAISVQGKPWVERAGRAAPLRAGQAIAPGGRVFTLAQDQAELRYRGTTRLTVGPRSSVTLEDPARARAGGGVGAQVVQVDAGALSAEVGPQPADRVMLFLTPHARVTVVGTRLAFLVGPRQTEVRVTEGHVLFERLATHEVEELWAGQRALAGAADPAPPAPPTASASERAAAGSVVFSYDFEDGEVPRVLKQGHLVSGPCRAGSRFCAIGMLDPWDFRSLVVAAVGSPDVAYYSPGMVFSFDYWTAADHVWIQAWNTDRQQNHNLEIPNPAPETWQHAEVRLADLVGERRRPWQPGDRIQNVRVHGGPAGSKPFYVDNIRLVDRPDTQGGSP